MATPAALVVRGHRHRRHVGLVLDEHEAPVADERRPDPGHPVGAAVPQGQLGGEDVELQGSGKTARLDDHAPPSGHGGASAHQLERGLTAQLRGPAGSRCDPVDPHVGARAGRAARTAAGGERRLAGREAPAASATRAPGAGAASDGPATVTPVAPQQLAGSAAPRRPRPAAARPRPASARRRQVLGPVQRAARLDLRTGRPSVPAVRSGRRRPRPAGRRPPRRTGPAPARRRRRPRPGPRGWSRRAPRCRAPGPGPWPWPPRPAGR